jgi:hypothetical protein
MRGKIKNDKMGQILYKHRTKVDALFEVKNSNSNSWVNRTQNKRNVQRLAVFRLRSQFVSYLNAEKILVLDKVKNFHLVCS